MIHAIQADPDAIGFCRLSDLTDPATGSFYGQITVIPIDKNQNGRIDFFEDIYVSRESLIRGIWIGKYPKSLYSDILAVAPSRPAGSRELAFLEWVVSDGQKYLNPAGYSEINSLQAENAEQALVPAVTIISAPQAASASPAWILIFATLIIAVVLISPVLLVRRKKPAIHAEDFRVSLGFSEASLSAPAGMFFDKTHTWAFLEKDGRVRIGMDDFMQHVTGPLSRVILKSPGEMIRKGEKVLTVIQDGKHLELCAPVSGIIRENNPKLQSDCTPMNSSPYSDGWIYLVEPRNWLKEILFLLPGKQYSEWIRDEFTRLKDFFASLAQKNNLVYAHVVLQDGGEISDHVLSDLGPEVWEEFQNYFLDMPK
jgi:glycine cleavage system H lipoate-binding protein